ncbi:ribonuclease J [Acholeplasma sp. OttesenSCG-928-E16]|nr:ribonuclease J [Acholeplasma sp. OttesenSCG-928-E16]
MKNKLLKDGEIGIFALGGLGEVGKNTYIYEIEDQIFIIDAGILFPDDSLLGIDYVIPDYDYLVQNEERIVGLFITHGHEDHIGGIPYLLKKVNIPRIYASGIAVDLIEYKFQEHPDIKPPQIEEFKANYSYKFKGVEVSFIRLNHSIPDMFGIVLDTKHGPLFHTGDFKIDFTPVGPPAEYEKLTALSKRGALCLLSDSTNAEKEGTTPSEGKIGKSIDELFQNIDGRIIIVTFASNLYRIQQIIEATVLTNRKIAVFGRSMERAIEAGQQSGYINAPKGTFVDSDKINDFPPSEVVLLCTGSQGEPLAALSRIANGSHKFIKTMPDDTVIFSSSPIPGNQEGINKIINALFKSGINVIVHSPITDTHTSGHGAQNDLKMMLSLVRPKFFIPVHGEHRMLKIHQNLAIDCGIKEENTLVMDNGDVAALTADSIRLAGRVQSGDIYIDGTGVGDVGNKVLKERAKLSQDGMFSIIVSINSKNRKLITNPSVISRGFIYMKGSTELTSELANDVVALVNEKLASDEIINIEYLKTDITKFLDEKIYELTLRNPLVIPIIVDVAN